jgi:hypothetical protein
MGSSRFARRPRPTPPAVSPASPPSSPAHPHDRETPPQKSPQTPPTSQPPVARPETASIGPELSPNSSWHLLQLLNRLFSSKRTADITPLPPSAACPSPVLYGVAFIPWVKGRPSLAVCWAKGWPFLAFNVSFFAHLALNSQPFVAPPRHSIPISDHSLYFP